MLPSGSFPRLGPPIRTPMRKSRSPTSSKPHSRGARNHGVDITMGAGVGSMILSGTLGVSSIGVGVSPSDEHDVDSSLNISTLTSCVIVAPFSISSFKLSTNSSKVFRQRHHKQALDEISRFDRCQCHLLCFLCSNAREITRCLVLLLARLVCGNLWRESHK